ncbi:MAG: OmpH family outer membrane protein [bacterium]
MKKMFLILMAVALPLFAMAQDIKVGYLNSQEVMMMMPEVSDVEKQLATYNEQNTKYLQGMQEEIQAKYNKYLEEKETLSPAIARVQEEELMGLQQRYETAQQTLYQESQSKQMELIKPLQEKLIAAIATVSKKQGLLFTYDTISGALLYQSEKMIDITSAVKKELGIL